MYCLIITQLLFVRSVFRAILNPEPAILCGTSASLHRGLQAQGSRLCFVITFFCMRDFLFNVQVTQYQQTVEQLSGQLELLKDNNEKYKDEVT